MLTGETVMTLPGGGGGQRRGGGEKGEDGERRGDCDDTIRRGREIEDGRRGRRGRKHVNVCVNVGFISTPLIRC